MAPDSTEADSLVTSFCELTGMSEQVALQYLTASEWDLDRACTAYYADWDDGEHRPSSEPETAAAGRTPVPEYTGPRTLDGRPAPEAAAASSSSANKPQKRTGLATLSSLGGGHSHDDDDDDEDDDDEDERRGPRDLFAGGEKSGLAVQDPAQRSSDPKKLINDIVAKARANAKKTEEGASSAPGPSRFFGGGGQTLGGDGVESRRVGGPPPSAIPTAASEPARQQRTLHLWADGFSIDDGDLRRFDDPQNQADLQMIRQGRAPVHLMNIQPDERVDVKLEQHAENYRRLPRIYRPFGGEGRRLGSPVPGVGSVAPPPASTQITSAPAQSAPTTVDESRPTLMLRVQLPDGTRLPARFNVTQTVGDVYSFIQRASPSLAGRPWILSTTFPNKDHTEKELVLGDMAEFKKGGTAVVKWV